MNWVWYYGQYLLYGTAGGAIAQLTLGRYLTRKTIARRSLYLAEIKDEHRRHEREFADQVDRYIKETKIIREKVARCKTCGHARDSHHPEVGCTIHSDHAWCACEGFEPPG